MQLRHRVTLNSRKKLELWIFARKKTNVDRFSGSNETNRHWIFKGSNWTNAPLKEAAKVVKVNLPFFRKKKVLNAWNFYSIDSLHFVRFLSISSWKNNAEKVAE